MTAPPPLQLSVSYVGHVAAFAVAALVCFASIPRARAIAGPDTQRGLVWLLLTSGVWAASHVLYLVASTAAVQEAIYLLGQVVGLATVGAWLYFCSAYTGRSLHRNALVRRVAVTGYLGATALKLTNPLHHLYYTTELVTTPFSHLAIHHGLLHWALMGLSYALATVGFFMLFELFVGVDYDATPLLGLLAVTGAPVGLDVLALVSPVVLDIAYEPLGVAAFAVGVCFVYFDRLNAIQLTSEHENPTIALTEDDSIRGFNASAEALFSESLDRTSVGEPFYAVLPEAVDALESEDAVFERERGGETRYYHVTETVLTAGNAPLGELLTFEDVTDREQYRRELERQNARLEQFASMVSHDLRNPLNVAQGRLELAQETYDDEHLQAVDRSLARMAELIDDLLQLARQGRPIDERERVRLEALAKRSWASVETEAAELVVDGDLAFEADPERVQQLLENLFRNAIEHGGSDVTVTVGPLPDESGFYVADDGPGIPADEREDVFESGYTTSQTGTGFGLAIVAEIVEAHGWAVTVTESDAGGARFEITGLDSSRRLLS